MKKIVLVLSYSELSCLADMLRQYHFGTRDIDVLVMYVIKKIFQRITNRLLNVDNQKHIKFGLKNHEAVSLRIVLCNFQIADEYYNNTALRIVNTITQSLT